MKVINTKKFPGIALALAALMFSYTNAHAASSGNIVEAVQSTVLQEDNAAKEFRTHDNGNYHRFHSNSSVQHSQIDNKRRKIRKEHRPYRYSYGSDLGFRRYHHFPHDRYYGGYHYGLSDRRFINTLIGGAVLYGLFK